MSSVLTLIKLQQESWLLLSNPLVNMRWSSNHFNHCLMAQRYSVIVIFLATMLILLSAAMYVHTSSPRPSAQVIQYVYTSDDESVGKAIEDLTQLSSDFRSIIGNVKDDHLKMMLVEMNSASDNLSHRLQDFSFSQAVK